MNPGDAGIARAAKIVWRTISPGAQSVARTTTLASLASAARRAVQEGTTGGTITDDGIYTVAQSFLMDHKGSEP